MTPNEEPSGESGVGVAFVAPELGSASVIAVGDHTGSEIVPAWPFAVAFATTNVTPPKFASGSTVHRPMGVQAAGASATHSADDTSGVGDAMVRRFWNVFFFCVTFVMRIVTLVLETATLAAIPSPAFIGSLIVTGAAGTSSYQTEYVTRPLAEQFAWVPTCSSACDVGLNPPRPTQKAENVGVPAVHVAAGCLQAPEALEYDTADEPSGADTA